MDHGTPSGTDDDGVGDRARPAVPKEQRALLCAALNKVATYHHMDDSAPYVFCAAVATSNRLDGSPLWGMVVGPSSGGKTEAVELVHAEITVNLDDVTTPGLLSWSKITRQRPRAVPVGALVRVGDRGLIAILDFSTVLTDDRGRRSDLFDTLRRVYDGHFERSLGNEDDTLRWEGRITILAACTSAIDNYSSHTDALGPRWVYLRPAARTAATRQAVIRRALRADAAVQKAAKAEAQDLAGRLISKAGDYAHTITLSDEMNTTIEDAATVACFGRASVPRDSHGKREIVGLPEVEEPPRVAKQLQMLHRCSLALGLTEEEAVAMTARSALDSMPAIRAMVLRAGGEGGAHDDGRHGAGDRDRLESGGPGAGGL